MFIDFEPNLKKTITYMVINTQDKEIQVDMYVTGELKDYIKLTETKAILKAGETKSFTFEINLPSKLDRPGNYEARIGAIESIPTSAGEGATVAARTAVESLFFVRVPYPGKYIEIKLDTKDANLGQTAAFTITISNLGELDVTASDEIDIFDPANNKLVTLFAGETKVKSKESGNLYANWQTTKDIKPGTYRAVANVKYNGNSATAEKSFKVGELLIDIVNIKVDKIKKDGITKFEIELESFWNEKIPNVFVEVQIFDKDGNKITTVKNESVDMAPWEKKSVTAYLDTKGLEAGKYDAKVILHYQDKTTEKTIEVEIVAFPYTVLIIIGIAVSIAVAAAVYIKTVGIKRRLSWKESRKTKEKNQY